MISDGWPKDPYAAAALVALVILDIDDFKDADRDRLLSEFLRTAWPSHRAQCQ
jgi:hypothetical protein